MGKKRKHGDTLETVLARPWCYYCERDFDDLKILVDHQKAKHFQCHVGNCHRRLNTAGGLKVHMAQVHKEELSEVPNALENRKELNIEIFGMEGVPQSLVDSRRAIVTAEFHKMETEHLRRTGNPISGSAAAKERNEGNTNKKPKMESKEDLKRRIAEAKAKSQATKDAQTAQSVGSLSIIDNTTPDPSPPPNGHAMPQPPPTYAPGVPYGFPPPAPGSSFTNYRDPSSMDSDPSRHLPMPGVNPSADFRSRFPNLFVDDRSKSASPDSLSPESSHPTPAAAYASMTSVTSMPAYTNMPPEPIPSHANVPPEPLPAYANMPPEPVPASPVRESRPAPDMTKAQVRAEVDNIWYQLAAQRDAGLLPNGKSTESSIHEPAEPQATAEPATAEGATSGKPSQRNKLLISDNLVSPEEKRARASRYQAKLKASTMPTSMPTQGVAGEVDNQIS